MGKIIRHEFLGSSVIFFLLCISIVFIPFAYLYLVQSLVTVKESMENPSEFLEDWKNGKFRPSTKTRT